MTASLEDGFTGGCQCGACRFTVAPGPVFASLCHCRMCQRTVLGPGVTVSSHQDPRGA